MIFPIGFTHHSDFLGFKKAIGHLCALEFLLNLFEGCRSRKRTDLFLPDDQLTSIMILPPDIDPTVVKAALIEYGMITPIPDHRDWFEATLFLKENARFVSNWCNGEKGGRPRKEPAPGNTIRGEKTALVSLSQRGANEADARREPTENQAED